MQKWHFRIYGKVLIQGSNKELYIHPENIATLIRVSDYRDEHMPRILMRVRLDKNLIDYIVSNAKTATIYLKIEKFDKQEQDMTADERNYIVDTEDEFSIFVGNDINCNKEIDYKESVALDEPERKDVYQEIYIGLISKKCIEANKVTANVVFRETAMMSMVGYYMQGTHLLIEPFKFNPTIDQLTIPPQETLYKTIRFLDNIKVFYDTSFLFFIDEPKCTYLISRSGNGIEKKDDTFLDVCFNINPKDGENYGVPGMKEDKENNRFFADIAVADTKYTIDHDTAKIYTKIQEIINPEIKNTTSTMADIQSAADDISSIVDQVKKTADGVVKDFNDTISEAKGVAKGLYDMKTQAQSSMKDFLDPSVLKQVPAFINKFNDLIKRLPGSLGGGSSSKGSGSSPSISIISDEEKKSIKNTLNSQNSQLANSYKKVQEFTEGFCDLSTKSIESAYKLGSMNNNFGCFGPVNSQYGVKDTNKNIAQSNTDVDNVKTTNENLKSNQQCIDDTYGKYNDIVDTISKVVEKVESALSKSGAQKIAGADKCKQILQDLKNVKQALGKAGDLGKKIKDNLDTINKQVEEFQKMPEVLDKAKEGFNNLTSSISKISKIDLTAKIKGVKIELGNIGQNAEKALDKIRNIGKGSLSFGLGDLAKAKDNLSAISDLTGVGKLGKSSFDTKLNIGQAKEGIKEGSKILKTTNDNSNKIKNIKSDIENQLNQVYINKYDLDPSVFTPNKKYTIKNYNGHQNKDGLFLLNRKTEVYIREDDSFLCNTMLDFGKVADIQEGEASSNQTTTQ